MLTLPRPKIESSTLDVFKYVIQFLGRQGCQSKTVSDGVEVCQYRGENDTKCAVGCLISDNHYVPEFEENSVNCLSSSVMTRNLYPNYIPIDIENMIQFFRKNLKLLTYLQIFHDENDNWESKSIFRQNALTSILPVLSIEDWEEARRFVNDPELVIAIPVD